MLLPMMDKKKIVSIVLGEKPSESKEIPEGLESDFAPAYKASAADMIKAIKEDEPEKLVMSLKEFFELCEREKGYESEDEEEEDYLEE